MFGLKQGPIDLINAVFAQYPQIEQVIVYGSRAKGNYKPSSDIDLTIKGTLDYSSLLKLENQLDDLLLPYKIDLSLYHKINHPDLIDHIKRVGKVFYEKSLNLDSFDSTDAQDARNQGNQTNHKNYNTDL